MHCQTIVRLDTAASFPLGSEHGQEIASPAACAPRKVPRRVSSVRRGAPSAEPIQRAPLSRDRGSLRRREECDPRSCGIERRAPGHDGADARRSRCRHGARREGIVEQLPARHSARRNERGPAPRQRPAGPLTRHGGTHVEVQRQYQPHRAEQSHPGAISEAQRVRTGDGGARPRCHPAFDHPAAPLWAGAQGCDEVSCRVRRAARESPHGTARASVAASTLPPCFGWAGRGRCLASDSPKEHSRKERTTPCSAK